MVISSYIHSFSLRCPNKQEQDKSLIKFQTKPWTKFEYSERQSPKQCLFKVPRNTTNVNYFNIQQGMIIAEFESYGIHAYREI